MIRTTMTLNEYHMLVFGIGLDANGGGKFEFGKKRLVQIGIEDPEDPGSPPVFAEFPTLNTEIDEGIIACPNGYIRRTNVDFKKAGQKTVIVLTPKKPRLSDIRIFIGPGVGNIKSINKLQIKEAGVV